MPQSDPDPAIKTKPADNGHGEEVRQSAEPTAIWVVNERSDATVRSRFYKALILGVASAFQLISGASVIPNYGPATAFGFVLATVVTFSIACHEFGAVLSAVELRPSRLKEALWGTPGQKIRAKRNDE